jgi:hypothetical protein
MKVRHNLTAFTGGRWTISTRQQTFVMDLSTGQVELADGDGRYFPLIDDQRFRIQGIDVLELGRPARFSMTIPADSTYAFHYSWTTDPVVSITSSPKRRRDGFTHVDFSSIYDPYTPSELTMCQLLGIQLHQLESIAADGQALQLVTRDGAVIYPLLQVTADGKLLPGLDAVICELAGGTSDRWTWWLWLTSKPAWAGGREVWELLREKNVDSVVRAASRAAWTWRQ